MTSPVRVSAIEHTITPTDDTPDTNVAGGLWSTAEVQVGFICANLPHTQHLATRCFQRWRPRLRVFHSGGDRPRANDYGNSSNTWTRSRRGTAGFQNLGSKDKSNATATAAAPTAEWDDAERGDNISREEASVGVYDSDHELISMGGPPFESGVGRVEVLTEVRQEVQRMGSPGAYGHERREWGDDTVSTEITAKGAGF